MINSIILAMQTKGKNEQIGHKNEKYILKNKKKIFKMRGDITSGKGLFSKKLF